MPLEQRIGGAEFSENFVVGHGRKRALGCAASGFNMTCWTSRLRVPKAALIEAAKSDGATALPVSSTSGEPMRLMGWAIALAAAGLTPAAAAQGPATPLASAPAPAAATTATPSAGT